MPLEVLDIAWPGSRPLAARRPAGSIMRGRAIAAAGSTSRSAGSAAPAWCSRRSRSTSASPRSSTATRRRCARSPRATARSIGRAQARFAPMGGGPLVAELMNAPLFAQLRYVGPADTLWRLSGSEVLDLSGPIAVGADIGGRLGQPGRSAARSGPRTRGSKARSPAWSSTSVASQARFSGPQLIFSQITGQHRRRRLGHRQRHASLSPAARPRSTCRSTPARRCCSTATMSPRG